MISRSASGTIASGSTVWPSSTSAAPSSGCRANGEAWLGLAASYDRLRRYELADRAYNEALKIYGPRPEVLNNIGYSYMLRGDLRKARAKFQEAQAQDPEEIPRSRTISRWWKKAAHRRKGLN